MLIFLGNMEVCQSRKWILTAFLILLLVVYRVYLNTSLRHGPRDMTHSEQRNFVLLNNGGGERNEAKPSPMWKPETQLNKHSVEDGDQLEALLNTSLASPQNGLPSPASTSDTDSITILDKVPEQRLVPSSSDIFVSVKTSNTTEEKRLPPMLLTWMQTVHPKQIHIVTDVPSHWSDVAQRMGFEVITTDCSYNHNQTSLCCKSGREYEIYFAVRAQSDQYSWFCHFDDDVYVNVPALVKFLEHYNGKEDKHYFGHFPDRIWSKAKHKPTLWSHALKAFPEHTGRIFEYATGASYCISSSLMDEIKHYMRDSASFVEVCRKLSHPDDLSVGAVIECLLGYNLTEVPAMLSHIERLKAIASNSLKDMISIGYKIRNRNIVNITNGAFSIQSDPTRFLSYHCLLYETTSWCPLKLK